MLNINPMWFYWLNIVDTLNGTIAVAALIAVIAGVIILLLGISTLVDDEDEVMAKRFLKLGAVFIIIAVVCWLGYIFVPNKETLIEMQVAKLATPENAAITAEKLKEVVDYIIEKVATLK